jgi:hypothetical protein
VASWAAGSWTTAASEGSRGAAEVPEPQQAVAASEPLRSATAAETRQPTTVTEPRQAATDVEQQQAVMVTTATTAMAVSVPSTPPAPAAAYNPRAAVVEVLDDDVPPPGWDQWPSLPTSAPEASTGVLVVRDDGGAALGCPADGVGASSSHAGPATRPEQVQERAGAQPAHFVEA